VCEHIAESLINRLKYLLKAPFEPIIITSDAVSNRILPTRGYFLSTQQLRMVLREQTTWPHPFILLYWGEMDHSRAASRDSSRGRDGAKGRAREGAGKGGDGSGVSFVSSKKHNTARSSSPDSRSSNPGHGGKDSKRPVGDRDNATPKSASTPTPAPKNKDKNPKKKARKSKKALAAKPVAAAKPAVLYSSKDSSNRSYCKELEEYLESWENRETKAGWKFNKVIQSWGLENCLHKDKIDTDLFKRLIPYILTVQGGAKDRLLSAASDIITKCENGEAIISEGNDDEETDEVPKVEGDDNDETPKSTKPQVSKKMLKRAMKIKSVLN
jgi:hypothetical protein